MEGGPPHTSPHANMLLPLLLLSALMATASSDACSEHYLKITSHNSHIKLFVSPASFGRQSGSASGPLLVPDPPEACVQPNIPGMTGAIALVTRGMCSFEDKARLVQESGGKGIIVRNNASMVEDPAPCMDGGDPSEIRIVAGAVTWEMGNLLADVAKEEGRVRMEVAARHPVLSSVLLWAMAVGALVWGSLWSGMDYSRSKRNNRRRVSFLAGEEGEDSEDTEDTGTKPVILDVKTAVFFVLGASAMLVVLYLFLSQAVYFILLGGFVLAATQGLAVLIASLVGWVFPWCDAKPLKFGQCGKVPLSHASAALLAFIICIVWAFYRNSPGSWVVQDIIGISVLVFALRVIRIPSLKVATIMLSLFLVYDVFWVFIQPMITPSQKSIMVDVATAKGLHEYMPIVLRVPSIWESGIGDFSILGYGDVIMPGLLVAYTRRLDLCMDRKLFSGYYIYCVCGYGIGLLITFGAQFMKIGGGTGQPALLYLVPCTLGVVGFLSLIRSEFCLLMSHTQKDEDSEVSRSDSDIEPEDEV